MYRKTCFFVLITLINSFSLFSQVKKNGTPYIKNYSIDDYSNEEVLASTQNWSAFQDEKGIMYFGNTNGLLIFDGVYWDLIEMPNNSTVRSIKQAPTGKIFIGAEGEFGFLSHDEKGRVIYKSLTHKFCAQDQNFSNVWNIYTVNNEVIFETDTKAFLYDGDTVYSYNAEGNFLNSFVSNEKVFFLNDKLGLLEFTSDGFEQISSHRIFKSYGFALKGRDDDLIIISREYGFFKYDDKGVKNWNVKSESKILEKEPYCATRIDSLHFAIGTQLGGIYIINFDGETVRIFNKENGLQANTVYHLFMDYRNNLWATLGNGISYFKLNSPFSYFDNLYNIPRKNYSVEFLEDNMYFGNEVGIYTKPISPFNSSLEINKFQLIKGSEGQVWNLIRHNESLIAAHNGSILLISDNKVVSRILEGINIWHIRPSLKTPEEYFAFTGSGIYRFFVRDKKLILLGRYKDFNKESRYAEVENDSVLWTTNYINGIEKIVLSSDREKIEEIVHYSEEDGLPQNSLSRPCKAMNQIFFATSEGVCEIDKDSVIVAKKINDKYNISGQTFLFESDSWDRIWIQDREALKFVTENQNLIELPFNRFRGQNLSRISIVSKEDVFFAGDRKVIHYNPAIPFKEDSNFNVHIGNIINLKDDSLITSGFRHLFNDSLQNSRIKENKLVLPYRFNNLRIEYSASYYEKPGETRYKVWLTGFEDNNLSWTREVKKDYTNLPEGEYVFHVKAKNIYNLESPTATFKFEISPPWYRSVWAYVFYFLVLVVIVYFVARLYAYKVKKDKRKLENIVYKSTEEIRKQSEEILYQNAKILKQKEEIQEKAYQLEEANAELEKLSVVASETDNAVIITDREGKIEWVNPGFSKLYGYTINELKDQYGPYLQNFNPNTDFRGIPWDDKESKKVRVFESVIKTKSDEIIEVQTTQSPIYNSEGEIQKFVIIDTDIRDLKKYEYELQKVVATKDKFFSIVAHDLKNPFNSLLGAASLLINKKDKLDEDRIHYFHHNIYKVAKQGYDLLENLLEWARSQTGRIALKPEELNLSDLANEAIELLASNATNKEIKIENNINTEYTVVADRNTIKTAFRNLLSNAIKYTLPHGEVKIDAEIDGKYKKVSISDSGIGIPPKDLSKLFKVDVRYSRRGTAEESGTGLGLILCKEFIEKNHGKIYVQSKEGEGSTFYFTLPSEVS